LLAFPLGGCLQRPSWLRWRRAGLRRYAEAHRRRLWSLEEAIVPTNAPGEVDRIIGMPMRWGTGWHIGSAAEGATMRTFGHGGRGGQMGWADLDRGLAFGFVTSGQLKAEEYQNWLLGLQSLAFRACAD
jgi:CubicO group peptidase (beta-lactamase class C family)